MLLRNGKNSVWVSPQGGSILRWEWNNQTVLGPMQTIVRDGVLKTRGESHLCFPNFGSVPDGVSLKYKKHGFLRDTLLDIYSVTKDTARFELTAVKSSIETEVNVIISAGEDNLSWSMHVRNRGKARVPLLPAFHPYFKTPMGGATITIGGQSFSSETLGATAQVFERKGQGVQIALPGIGIVDMILPNFGRHIVLWSDKPTTYFCVEPVFGEPGTFGKEGGNWLGVNEGDIYNVTFRLRPEHR